MKIDAKLIRVAKWFDADNHTTVHVVEIKRKGRWVGLMLSGQPQVYQIKSDAEAVVRAMTGLDVPEEDITRRRTCVAQHEGGKGIVPTRVKPILLN